MNSFGGFVVFKSSFSHFSKLLTIIIFQHLLFINIGAFRPLIADYELVMISENPLNESPRPKG